MHAVTREIREALNKFIAACGSALEAERRTGITNSTLSKYRSGRICRMNNSTWNALEPHLRPYLPAPPSQADAPPPAPAELSSEGLNRVIALVMNCRELSDGERMAVIRILLGAKSPCP